MADAPPPAPEPAPPVAPSQRQRRASPRFVRDRERPDLKSRLSVAFAVTLSRLVSWVPTPLRNWGADRVGDVWLRLTPVYRANVVANVDQVIGPGAPPRTLDRLARQIFRISARNFGDLLRAPHLGPREMARIIPLESGEWAYFDDARAQGRGVVLVTAHLGAFDVIGMAIAARGYKLTSMTGRTTTRFLFDAVTRLRRAGGMNVVEATPGGVRTVIQALRRAEVAAFVADYDFFQNGLPVTFFGRETTLPPGPVRIARDTNAVIVGVFSRRVGNGYALRLTPPFEVPKTRDMDADLAAGMARLTAMLERAIGASPGQWVMFQRVWPDAPAEPLRVFPVGSPLESDLLRRVDAVLPGTEVGQSGGRGVGKRGWRRRGRGEG